MVASMVVYNKDFVLMQPPSPPWTTLGTTALPCPYSRVRYAHYELLRPAPIVSLYVLVRVQYEYPCPGAHLGKISSNSSI